MGKLSLNGQMFGSTLLVKEEIYFAFSGPKINLHQNDKKLICEQKQAAVHNLIWQVDSAFLQRPDFLPKTNLHYFWIQKEFVALYMLSVSHVCLIQNAHHCI